MNSKLRSKVINELANDEYFACLSSHKERLSYILEEKLSFKKLRNLVAPTIAAFRKKAGKCVINAKQFSEEADLLTNLAKEDKGSQFYWDEALEAYKKAILHAPIYESAFLSQLYLRKFKVHLKTKDSAAALFSAKTAVEFFMKNQKSAICLQEEINFAKKWIEKQTDTSGNCTEICSSQSEPYMAFFIDSSCKIECSPDVGRHFVAAEDITEGQILLEEYPYCTILMPKYVLEKCTNCHVSLGQSFYPCANCTEVLFCSASCASQANTEFHSQECGLKAVFNSLSGTQTSHVFRMIAKAGGPLAMIKRGEQLADYSVMDYLADGRLQFSRPAEKNADERMATYAMSSTLIDHDEVHSASENVCHSMIVLEIASIYELVSGVELSNDARLSFATLLIGDLRRIVFNAFGWQTWSSEEDGDCKLEHIAHAQCLVASLVNHNCDCNTTWEFTGSGMIRFTANRDIISGEEITISYGTCPAMSYHQRQKRLNDYYFACACSACFADVCKSPVLRCDACPTGAVPVLSVIDRVPQLRGKCLRCFSPYSDFDEAIDRLRSGHKTLSAFKSISLALKFSSTASQQHQQQMMKIFLKDAVEEMRVIACLSLPSSADVQAAVSVFSEILQNVGVKTLKEVFTAEELHQLALYVGCILLHEQEDVFKNNKVNKKKVTMKEISLLNFWFDLSTSLLDELLEQCVDHQKLLYLALAIGTKMNYLLVNLVNSGLAMSKGEYLLASLVHCRTVAIEKKLKLLPEVDDTSNEVN